MKKILNKVGLDSMYLIMIKAIHDKPRANITFNGEKLKVIPLKSGTRQGGTLFLLLFSIVLEVLARAVRQAKEIKDIQIGKEDIQLSLFVDYMILCIENPKDSTKKLLEIINKFSSVAGYKVNIQKSVAFIYNNNELLETEIKKTVSFTTATRRIKNLGINLSKAVKDLYAENCKTLLKEIEEDK